jgi:putative MATE family efflux protein
VQVGEGKKAEAEHVLGNTAVLLLLGSILVTAVGLPGLNRILRRCGASDTVMPYARDYLQIIVLGTVFQTVGFGLNASIRGEGNPRIAMLSMLISVVLNAILAPILIFGFGWGMRGAALATVISQAVMAVWVVVYFFRGASVLRFHAGTMRWDAAISGRILVLGLPHFAMQIANSVLQSILNHQLSVYGGDDADGAGFQRADALSRPGDPVV